MLKYKSVVTDYEGMQAQLDTHAAHGWKLFSVTPDTWRKSVGADGSNSLPFEDLNTAGKSAQEEYSASYYLLIFHREEYVETHELAAAAEEPQTARHFYEG